MNPFQPYSVFPLGDSALTIDFGNLIQEDINRKILRLFHHLKAIGHPAITDLVPAYSSLTVYYDVAMLEGQASTSFEAMVDILGSLLLKTPAVQQLASQSFSIPVCYARRFAMDIDHISECTHLSAAEIIELHMSRSYRVYMLGFLPGFTYMGDVDDRISIARKPTPVRLFAGAVGIAGRQTGIYPMESPGGWQIIGRTPVRVFNKEERNPVLFQPGDEVSFYSISEDEFENYKTGRT